MLHVVVGCTRTSSRRTQGLEHHRLHIRRHPSSPETCTGTDINVNNFLTVLLGDRSALTGIGSGKPWTQRTRRPHLRLLQRPWQPRGPWCAFRRLPVYTDDLMQAPKSQEEARCQATGACSSKSTGTTCKTPRDTTQGRAGTQRRGTGAAPSQ